MKTMFASVIAALVLATASQATLAFDLPLTPVMPMQPVPLPTPDLRPTIPVLPAPPVVAPPLTPVKPVGPVVPMTPARPSSKALAVIPLEPGKGPRPIVIDPPLPRHPEPLVYQV
jgi:hypothetical protein